MDPLEHAWWLASRAAGIAALLCITLSIGVGLAMAGRLARGRAGTVLMGVHRHAALVGMVLVAVHGVVLLGDGFLRPSIGDVLLPFTSSLKPFWVGLGVLGGWLAVVLGLSWWVRDRIGPARWRSLHRATILVYVLSVAHTLGAGTDAGSVWLQVLMVVTGAPILFLFVLRVTTPRAAPVASPFRRFRVSSVEVESADVKSFSLVPEDGGAVPPFLPGQFVPLRVGEHVRSYSLCGSRDTLRIGVKRDGVVSARLHDAVSAGDVVELGAPAGAFVLDESSRPVVLLSAGIGVTPVLAMLASLASARSEREVWWIHGARCGAEHPFADEVRSLLRQLLRSSSHVRYSRPDPWDEPDAAGRLTASDVLALGVPLDAAIYLCGTPSFVGDLVDGLRAAGVGEEQLRSESFGGVVPAPRGPSIAFARSDVSVTWEDGFQSLLELAEANDVSTSSSCRIGACHGCRATVLSGSVRHDPAPAAAPPAGSALLCCARPEGDVVLDV